jgi:cellulose synthase (UDP-forming)
MLSTDAVVINLLLTLGLGLFVLDAPVRQAWARWTAILLMGVLTCCYAAWRYDETLPAFGWSAALLWPWIFFSSEMFVILYELWSLFVLSGVSDHSPEADVYERRLRQMANLPTVDVFIPTYSEGVEILEATIQGAKGLDYPWALVTVWVLDDGRRPWLREMCARHGVRYLARPTNEHGKGGNLNYALPHASGEYVLVIDADFILQPNILRRTLGFLLHRPEVGLVQTPQHFRNPDPVQYNLLGGEAWTEEQHFFMTVVQPAREYFGNAFCVGSGWLVICEDLEISYALLARGYRTLYLNEPLAIGLAPESLPEYLKQRVRWCSGTMQHLYLKTGPFRGQLSLLQRLFYLETVVYWLTCPFTLLLLAAPILFWYTGLSAIHCSGEDVLRLLIPRFLATYLLMFWLSERKVMPPIAMIQKCVASFHLTMALGRSLVNPFGRPFSVTAKGQARDQVVVQWSILWMFLAVGVILLAGMYINLSGYYQVVEINEVTALDVGWSLYSLVMVALCALVCVELPKPEGHLNSFREVLAGSFSRTALALVKRLFG